MYDFSGKIAIVTGAASGIGLECVLKLLQNGIMGITIADINEKLGKETVEKLHEEFGASKVIFVKCDVTKADELESVFKITQKTWKNINILVNNAGVFDDAHWESEIEINCTSVTRGTLLAFKYMRENENESGGTVVNIASVYGLQKVSSCPIYVGTKHFVIGLSRSLGAPFHFDKTKVKILTLCPGVTDTELVRNASNYTLTEDMKQQIVEEFANLPSQLTKNVGNGLITIINEGSNGSVWVSEGSEPAYEIEFPSRLALRRKV